MDVKQIQYFSLVSSTGSFNAAAKQLYISVPGLVKAMDRLENELDVQLFVRRRSGVTLTPAGQALARYAPRYIRKYEMIVSNVRKAAALLLRGLRPRMATTPSWFRACMIRSRSSTPSRIRSLWASPWARAARTCS